MVTGTLGGTTSNLYIVSKIEWRANPSEEDNVSDVEAKLYYKRINEGFTTQGTGQFSITIDGTRTNVTKYVTITEDDWVLVMTATKTVKHNSDGTKKISITATGHIDGTTLTYTTLGNQVTLETIPRASRISSVSERDIGSNPNVSFTPYSASFYYKLNFRCGTENYTSPSFRPGTTSIYTYRGYRLTWDVAENFPNSTYGTMTATLYTYSDAGNTLVGEPHSVDFYIYLLDDEDSKPSVTMTLEPVTPYSKFASLYLRGISKVKATFSGEGQWNATVGAYSMAVDGKTYQVPSASNTVTSDTIANSGEVTIVGTGTDSRGYSNTDTKKINVIAYETPYISPYNGYNKVICERCTEDGTASDSGTYLHVKGKRNFTKINTNGIVNTCSVKCRYKPEGGSWSHGVGEGVSIVRSDATTDEFDVILTDIVFDPKVVYTVELNIVDDTNRPTAMEFSIPSEYVDFELREGGKGVAFGKHSTTESLLDCDWNARFRKKVTIGDDEVVDFVVEEKNEDIWYYRKWHSGKVECWGRRRVSVTISEAWGSIYYTALSGYAYPSGLFKFAPMCQVTAEFGGTMQAGWLGIGGKSTELDAPAVFFLRPNIADASFDILYYAIGNWK